MASSCEQIISGTIIVGTEFEPIDGYICLKDGIISEIGEEPSNTGTIIAPCFVNSHTHIGDSVCKDPSLGRCVGPAVIRDLDSLVRPPNGLKHQILRRTSYQALVESMRATILDMITTGTCAFADFREGGVVGVLALKEAIGDLDIGSLAFGRPDKPDAKITDVLSEVDRVLRNADGIGISGVNDMDIGMVRKIVKYTREQKRSFAIHAGEKDRTDIEEALSLKPDMLIHVTHANKSDISMMADVGKGPGCYHHRYCFMEGCEDGVVPGGVLNGFKAGNGKIVEIGDITKNWVIAEVPVDYPIIDTYGWGWTFGYNTNEYWVPNNAGFILGAIQVEKALRTLQSAP